MTEFLGVLVLGSGVGLLEESGELVSPIGCGILGLGMGLGEFSCMLPSV